MCHFNMKDLLIYLIFALAVLIFAAFWPFNQSSTYHGDQSYLDIER